MGASWRPRWHRSELLYVPRVVAYRAVRVSGILISSREQSLGFSSRRGSPQFGTCRGKNDEFAHVAVDA